MESSETPANIASPNMTQNNEEESEQNESESEVQTTLPTLTITFHSSGGMEYETANGIGTFHLWAAARLIQHLGDEQYTQFKIAQMQAEEQRQARGVQVARSLPPGLITRPKH